METEAVTTPYITPRQTLKLIHIHVFLLSSDRFALYNTADLKISYISVSWPSFTVCHRQDLKIGSFPRLSTYKRSPSLPFPCSLVPEVIRSNIVRLHKVKEPLKTLKLIHLYVFLLTSDLFALYITAKILPFPSLVPEVIKSNNIRLCKAK